MFKSKNYRSFLKKTLEKKKATNPRFSLRAFAKQLGISAPSLHQVIEGNRNLSPASALKIAQKLKLTAQEKDFFISLVQLEKSKDPELTAELRKKIRSMRPYPETKRIKDATFKKFEWFDSVIIACTTIQGLEFLAKVLARRIGITEVQAEDSIQRLLASGILAQESKGKYHQVDGRFLLDNESGIEGHVDNYLKVLNRIEDVVRTQPNIPRINWMETFSFPSSHIEEAKQLTEEYLTKILAISDNTLEEGVAHDHAYALQVNMVSLTPDK